VVAPIFHLGIALALCGAKQDQESLHYRIETIAIPTGIELEVSGMALLPDGRPLLATRRGEIWLLDERDPAAPRFKLWVEGLQEPLGLLPQPDGWVYLAQRGELSRLRDLDGDDRADEIETVCNAWRLSGNYHEYDFGPALDREGNFWITTNKPFGPEPFGRVDWRGFALCIAPDGSMKPMCAGLRSPAGVGTSPWGDLFYTDNQGEWCGASKLARLAPGDFHGHPWGLSSCERPEWGHAVPELPPDGLSMPTVKERIPSFQLPAVWFPYDKTGRSPSGFLWDQGEGRFGPFHGQLLVGDQFSAEVLRVFLERVEGHWQGAVFPFRSGFQCGIVRLCWDAQGSLLVGMTNRGWGGLGNSPFGLQRLVYTGVAPFEILEMRARPGGFELRFSEEIDPETAGRPEAFRLSSYTYLLHSDYGSPEVLTQELRVTEVSLGSDRRSLLLEVEGLREGFVHELLVLGLRSREGGKPLLHPRAWYTLIHRPREGS
jgi:hypothetical protein